MIYTVEEAKKMNCCAMLKPCSADTCMAWEKEVKAGRPPKEKSDDDAHKNHRGYCGLVPAK